MYELKDNESLAQAMFYTADALIHGEAVITGAIRVNIWFRTDSVPKYVHILNAQMISLTGNGHTMKFSEIFIPIDLIIAYHAAPSVEIDMDYSEDEPHRRMLPIKALGPSSLIVSGESRISMHTEFGTTLEVSRTSWLSLYNIAISNPNLPKMRLEAPMMLLRPEAFSFAPLE